MPYIVSKASQDTLYCGWEKGKSGLYKNKFSVLIKGGANVVNKKTLECPHGVVTEVTADELRFLKQNGSFKRHLERGWVFIENSKSGAEKLADEQEKDGEGFIKKDGSAQLLPEDFEREGKKPPVVGQDDK